MYENLRASELWQCVIFDLDGTLIDTSPGIFESIVYSTEKLGYTRLSQSQLDSFIGPPIRDSFLRCYACDEAEANLLTAAFREQYLGGAMYNAVPYEGIIELCRKLKESGSRIAVATNKPQSASEKVLRHFGFGQYLSHVHCADAAGIVKKSDLIGACVNDAETDLSQCVMIGDTEHDAKGAMEAGVPFLAVSYGFGSIEDMMKYPHIGIADKPADIYGILMREREVI